MARKFWSSFKEWSAHRRKMRAERNWARQQAIREGKASVGDGTHVHHKDGNPKNRSKRNRVVIDGGSNMKMQPKRKGRKYK